MTFGIFNNGQQVLQNLAWIATIIGSLSVPIGIIVFVIQSHRSLKERELATYSELSREYREFLKFCFTEKLDLELYEENNPKSTDLTEDKLIAFEILVSLLESSYFHYHRQTSKLKKDQWTGWDQFLRSWCHRPDFRKAWDEILGAQFDAAFVEYVNQVMKETRPSLG